MVISLWWQRARVLAGWDLERTCRSCKKLFILPHGELLFFRSKQFDLPIRCKTCRRARRQQPTKPLVAQWPPPVERRTATRNGGTEKPERKLDTA